MDKDRCEHIYTWDYAKFKPQCGCDECICGRYDQTEWNQTLITQINQASANILKASLRGGGDTIRVNQTMLQIIKTLAFFDENTMMLSGKYNIIIDDTILGNNIFIYNSKGYNPVAIPKYKLGITTEYDEVVTEILNLEFIPTAECTEEEILKYTRGCSACIEVINFWLED